VSASWPLEAETSPRKCASATCTPHSDPSQQANSTIPVRGTLLPSVARPGQARQTQRPQEIKTDFQPTSHPANPPYTHTHHHHHALPLRLRQTNLHLRPPPQRHRHPIRRPLPRPHRHGPQRNELRPGLRRLPSRLRQHERAPHKPHQLDTHGHTGAVDSRECVYHLL